MDNDVVKRKRKEKSGIFAGIVCILIATILLFYNESRAVDTRKVIGVAENEMIEISPTVIDQNNEGKLVVTSGQINLINDMVFDAEFNVSVKSAKLNRVVEMYQWDEECKDDSNGKEVCTYTKRWSSSIIDDSKFESGHNNPDTMPYQSENLIMSNVKLGEFKLNDKLLNQLSTNEKYSNLNEDVARNKNMYVVNEYYTTYNSEENPEVGDIRISFVYNNATDITVMGVQNNNSFIEFSTDKNDYTILELREKILSGKEFIKELNHENNTLTWVFRIVGTILMIAGVASILSIMKYLASYIPFLGKFVMKAIWLVSVLIGFALSLLIIAISWFVVRPVLSIILLLIIVGIIYLVIRLNKNKTKEEVNSNLSEENTKTL